MQYKIFCFQHFCLVMVLLSFFGSSHSKPAFLQEKFTLPSVGTFIPASDVDNTAVWNILFHFEEIQLHSLQSNDSGESSSEYDPNVLKLVQRVETELFCNLSKLTFNSSDFEESNYDLPGIIHLCRDMRMVIVATDNVSYHVVIVTKPKSSQGIPVLQVTKAETPLSPEKEKEISQKVSELHFKSQPTVTVFQKDCGNNN